jgi:RNA polymerase sigma factor (sigma-70 family)
MRVRVEIGNGIAKFIHSRDCSAVLTCLGRRTRVRRLRLTFSPRPFLSSVPPPPSNPQPARPPLLSLQDAGVAELSEWFSEEVKSHEPALRGFLHARFPGLREADDVVQESFVRVLRARAAHGITNAKSFLFSTARNLALDLVRREKVVPFESIEVSALPFVLDYGRNAADHLCHAEELHLLEAAIAALPARCREVLALRKLHGLPREEIARRLGISPATVNAQIALGMLRCRRYFQARDVIPADPDDHTS